MTLQKEKAKLQQEKRQNTINAKKRAQGLPEPSEAAQKKKRPPAKLKEPKVAVIFSESTDFGLAVTLKATLELLLFLCNECGFSYLMTARLTQDFLEVRKIISNTDNYFKRIYTYLNNHCRHFLVW